MRLNARGLGLIEVMIVVALLAVVGVTATTVVNNTMNANRVLASRAVNAALADALRVQLSRRATCQPSFATPPASFGGASQVRVTLGAVTVGAGVDLTDYNLSVNSLTVTNFTALGTTTTGNSVFLGDLVLQTQSPALDRGNRFVFRPITVARLTMEVSSGGTLVACYASDAATDQAQQIAQMCQTITSPEGVAGTWSGGRCVIPDASGATKCAQQGGTWLGSRCSMLPNVTTVARTVGPGVGGNTFYGANCPAGTSVTGGACYSQGGPMPPLNTAMFGNGFYCWWPSGYESTQYVVQATCAY